MNDYNFDASDIDESIFIPVIPQSVPHSLRNSRVIYQYAQSSPLYCQSDRNNKIDQNNRVSKKQNRMRELEELLDHQMMKECTFKPKTNVKNCIKKDFTSFLDHQKEHLRKVEQKTQKLYERLQRGELKCKAIKTNENRIQKEKVFERLYEQKQVLNEKQNMNENSFHPKISEKSQKLKRKQAIQDYLYKDAKQRKQKELKIEQKEDSQKQVKNVNYKNEQLIAKKFMRQYFSVLTHLNLYSEEVFEIKQEQFLEIIFHLGFLPKRSSSNEAENTDVLLAIEAYNFVKGYFASAINIFTFFLLLIGVYHINPISSEKENEKVLCLDSAQAKFINKKFNVLYRNRLHSQKNSGKLSIGKKNEFCNDESLSKQKMKKKYSKIKESEKIGNQEMQNLIINSKYKQSYSNNQQSQFNQSHISGEPQKSTKPKFLTEYAQSCNIMESQRDLSLVLQVNFGGEEQEIVLKLSDECVLPQIAKKYAQKYDIDSESEQQLLELLMIEISELKKQAGVSDL